MTSRERSALWIGVLLVVGCMVFMIAACNPSRSTETLVNVLISLGTGIATSVLILWLARKDRAAEMEARYAVVAGKYRRTFITEPASQHQEALREQNVGLPIEIKHDEENHIHISAMYWGEKEVEGRATFVDFSRYMATGQLRYKGSGAEDVGTYRIMRFEDAPNVLHVFYENVIPKNGAVGFEIWERITDPA